MLLCKEMYNQLKKPHKFILNHTFFFHLMASLSVHNKYNYAVVINQKKMKTLLNTLGVISKDLFGVSEHILLNPHICICSIKM